MMSKLPQCAMVALVFLFLLASSGFASSVSLAGKTIRLVVGFAPGGGADTDGRIVARHLGRHIPGNPRVIVQNMPGAGGVTALNLAYRVVNPDDLWIVQLPTGHYLLQVVGSEVVKFDLTRMPVLGSWAKDVQALFIRGDSPYRSIEAIRNAKEPPAIGTHGTATLIDIYNIAWQHALGIKLNLVRGYESRAQTAALERGEIHGRTNSVGGALRDNPHWVHEKFAPPVVQSGRQRDPRIPDAPTVYELNPDPGPFYEAINQGLSTLRPYVVPPGTPPDRVAVLRDAWEKLMKDKVFVTDAERISGAAVDPTRYDEIERFYKKAINERNPEVVRVLKEIFP